MRKLVVKNTESGQRIDKYIRKYLNNAPLSFIYKLFRKKDIKVNGKRVDINYVINEKDSFLYRIFGDNCAVNSFHHQAIKDVGNGIKVTSKCEDGVIEAIEHISLPIYATQFHPEMMAEKNEKMQKLFTCFVESL